MSLNNDSSTIADIVRNVRNDRLTYLSEEKLYSLADLCISVERNQVPGVIIEAGCALGGSSIVIAAAKGKTRQLLVYDVFGMIPPPSEKDGKDVQDRYKTIVSGESKGISGDLYYGYADNLRETVEKSFDMHGYPLNSNNVWLIEGLLQDTLQVNRAVSLAHIDVDWYESVYTCLERITPKLSVGGAIILDDYFDWSGCRSAVDKFFRDKKQYFSYRESARAVIITRVCV